MHEIEDFIDDFIVQAKKYKRYFIVVLAVEGVAVFGGGIYFMSESVIAGIIWFLVFGIAYIFHAVSSYKIIKNINKHITEFEKLKK